MHTGDISFCQKVGQNIKSNDFKEKVLEKIENKYKTMIIHRHFTNLNEGNIKYLKSNPYLACLRTNGNPYYFFLTKYNGINQAFFIDKKIQPNYHP